METIEFRPSDKQFVIDELFSIVMAIVFFVVGGMDVPCSSIFFCVALLFCIVIIYKYFYIRLTIYRITEEQLIYEHGVFTRSRDYVELYRIVDYDEKSSFLQQILGLKTITVISGDRSTPRLNIIGLPEQSDLVSTLRERVSYNRNRMNIHEFANYI